MTANPILIMEGITKRFSGHTALDKVDVSLAAGRVHALVGENGAGKSTLIKIMTGAYRKDAGTITVDGRRVDFRSPQDAQNAGVVAVYQEVHLLSYRTVAENLYLGREPRRWGFVIDRARMNAMAGEVLARLGLPIAPTAQLGTLTIALRQMVAIARGVSLGAKVVVLDEPTSSLSEREVHTLYEVIRRLKADGAAVVYISHRFDELYAVCDDVTILRDGRRIETRPLAGLERLDLVCRMLGKAREEVRAGTTAFGHTRREAAGAALLEVRGLRRGRRLNGVSLEVGRGEVVGMTGLLGSGRTETARAIFGLDAFDAGDVRFDGAKLAPRTPADAMRAGLAYLTEDRKGEGIIPELSVRENLTLAALPLLGRAGIVSRARQREVVDRFMKRLRIKASSSEQKIRELSGGNQQKVLLARWLCRDPKLLILDEPTRGVDLGAKAEIQALIDEMAGNGLAVLMISSELEEVIEGSVRVVVMRDGASVAELREDAMTQAKILAAMAGDDAPLEAAEGGSP